jgi:carboxyl-terminal processing protease
MTERKPYRNVERGALIATLVLILLGSLAATKAAGDAKKGDDDDKFWEFANVLNEVFFHVKKDYVEEVPDDLLYRGALSGIFRALDAHSAFMGADSFDQLEKETEGEFSGVGIHITLRDKILTVIAPIPGGPAAKLGVQPWDRIIEIDGESTEGISLTEAVRKLTGQRGTQVKVKIWRPGLAEGKEIEITRDTIKIPTVHHQVFDDQIGYIRLSKFADNASRDILKAVTEMREKGVEGLIIDMRFNPGGLLSEAVKISDLFLDRDLTIVSTKGRDDVLIDEYKSETDSVTDWPVMIMINEGSASASEIVTAALRDHRRALVIGPKDGKTFGKGSVQTITPLQYTFEKDDDNNPLHGAIKITTAYYYTPSGKTIHALGIVPDVEIEIPEGHNSELMRRGLLGDPNMQEPGDEIDENADAEDEADPDAGETLTISDEDGDSNSAFYIPEDDAADAEEEEEFKDIMLEESLRLMKAYLIMGGSNPEGIASL